MDEGIKMSAWLEQGPSRRFVVRACIAAFLVGMLLAVVTAVAPTVAKAGGLGDFYKSKKCWHGDRWFSVTNYDINYQKDQRYHFGTNVMPERVLFDNMGWPIATWEISDALRSSGTVKDGYQDFGNPVTTHKVTIRWPGTSAATCSVWL